MADSTDTAATAPSGTETGEQQAETQSPAPQAEVQQAKPENDWQAKAREWEKRAKANADAAKELQRIKDGELSELERAKKERDQQASELADLRRQNALLAKGIPADLTPPSVDASPDEWGDYADRLNNWRSTAVSTVVPQPKPDIGQGARQVDTKTQEDAEYAEYEKAFFTNNR